MWWGGGRKDQFEDCVWSVSILKRRISFEIIFRKFIVGNYARKKYRRVSVVGLRNKQKGPTKNGENNKNYVYYTEAFMLGKKSGERLL